MVNFIFNVMPEARPLPHHMHDRCNEKYIPFDAILDCFMEERVKDIKKFAKSGSNWWQKNGAEK